LPQAKVDIGLGDRRALGGSVNHGLDAGSRRAVTADDTDKLLNIVTPEA
jgi:hypothetical protein